MKRTRWFLLLAAVAGGVAIVGLLVVRVVGSVTTGGDGLPSSPTVAFIEAQPEASVRYPGAAQLFRFDSTTININLPSTTVFVATGFRAPGQRQSVEGWFGRQLAARGWQVAGASDDHNPPRHQFVRGREEFTLQFYPDVADSYKWVQSSQTVIFETTLSIESCSARPKSC